MTHPSELTPSFTTERLGILAREIVRIRRDAREVYQPEKGDNAWSHGCTCYARECAGLKSLSVLHPWLKVETEGLACTLFIESEPLKFYRGDPERPSDRSLRGGVAQAILQGKLQFFQDELRSNTDGGWFWLMAIVAENVTDDARVAVLQANESGETREPWFVPLEEEAIAVATAASAPEREGVDLEPPPVGPRLGDEETGGGSNGNKDGDN